MSIPVCIQTRIPSLPAASTVPGGTTQVMNASTSAITLSTSGRVASKREKPATPVGWTISTPAGRPACTRATSSSLAYQPNRTLIAVSPELFATDRTGGIA